MRRGNKDPRFPVEWQEAVNGARLLLLVDAMRQYGLVTGGPKPNVARCDEILRRGRRKGYAPQEDVVERALVDLCANH